MSRLRCGAGLTTASDFKQSDFTSVIFRRPNSFKLARPDREPLVVSRGWSKGQDDFDDLRGPPCKSNPTPRVTALIAKHPLHTMLVPIPIVCFVATLGYRHRLLAHGSHAVGGYVRVAAAGRG